MKFTYTVTLASAVLLAVGCAHESQQAQYDENLVPNSFVQTATASTNEAPASAVAPAAVANATATAPSADSQSQSDNAIVSSVRESLQRDSEIAPIVPNIEITANNGAVLLSGWVQSQEQKNQIGTIAQQAAGVMAVNNQLQALAVPVPQPPPTVANPPANPVLNPTSSDSNNPSIVYGNTDTNSDTATNAPLNPTSAPSTPNRTYQPDTQEQNGQVPDTNATIH